MSDGYHVSDQELRALMGAMTHDISNPLAAVVTNLEFAKRLCEQSNVDPDLADSVDDSVTACDVLRLLVANLDVLVKGKNLGRSFNELRLSSLLEEVIQQLKARTEQGGLTIELDTSQDQRVVTDRALLSLALENVLANSIQHAPRRSVVRVAIDVANDRTRIVVRDSGPRIPKDSREAAMSPQGNTHMGRSEATRYGRGATLLAARVAATAAGAELVIDEEDGASVMAIVIPNVASATR